MNDNINDSELIQDTVNKKKLYKKDLSDACKNIAKLRRPVSEIAKLAHPLGIPYYTVLNVFKGNSNHPEVLNILTKLGIPHNRNPIREKRTKKNINEQS
ncbi:hypothetical protein CH379_017840 [Leptospira ellisii]|uniref:Uncharacterized protein n=1 Tax=Leptospira ellisii TaxID=2023197 RepID=A0AAE4QQV5_9LEPT|nr:hypothetical protein [Leptospira ellisii]MDV6237498.1 hypothetical protein [Leptospira ellisii]